MRYTEIENTKESIFKRLTGVKRQTFEEMVSVIDDYKRCCRKHQSKGRPSKLSTADKLLMLLMYYREYRTFLHISVCYGISEMHCWRIITSTEQILLQSKIFHLPGKKALHAAENNFEIIVIDVSEHPIERPKKSNGRTIQERKSDIL
jgi:Helix-turn-helix of DDE superfamily endonuclease